MRIILSILISYYFESFSRAFLQLGVNLHKFKQMTKGLNFFTKDLYESIVNTKDED